MESNIRTCHSVIGLSMARSDFTLPQRVKIKALKYIYKNSYSDPFVSGDAISSICDFSICNEEDIEKFERVEASVKTVFCRSDLVSRLGSIKVSENYTRTLVAGNSDFDFTSKDVLPGRAFGRFFLQNSMISDCKKIFTLPVGVENLSIGINGLPKNLMTKVSWKDKSDSILVGPFSPTHESRRTLVDFAKMNPRIFDYNSNRISPKQFGIKMNSHKYVACPRGNGIDSHRFWETLYRGSVPIVIASNWSASLAIYKIPFIQVRSWSEVEMGIDQFVNSNYVVSPTNIEALWIPFWRRLFSNFSVANS
jgi:hypothetical protein